MRQILWILPLALTFPALAAGPAVPAPAGGQAIVRLGTHSGYSRVVFEFTAPTPFTIDRVGEVVVLHFTDGGTVPGLPGHTRHIASVAGGESMATVMVSPGARIKTMRLGNRVVLDVSDAPAARAADAESGAAVPSRQAAPSRAVARSHNAPAAPVLAAAPVRLEDPAAHAAPAEAPVATPAPVIPVLRAPEVHGADPSALAEASHPPPAETPHMDAADTAHAETPPEQTGGIVARRAELPPGVPGSAALLPFTAGVGAAAFRHGTEAWVVFDERRPLDLAALQADPALTSATIQLLPAATVLHLALPEGQTIRMARQADGWTLAAGPPPAAVMPLTPVASAASVLLPAPNAGQVVAVPDPATGQNLLVGTLRSAGPGVPVPYRVPEFTILPSWQGAVVEPVADRTLMRVVRDGFSIDGGNPLSPAADAARSIQAASVLTRRFDFPAMPTAGLLRRLQVQTADDGRAPAQSRTGPRKALAQTMLSLGLGAEAQSLLQLTMTEDPRVADDPDFAGLSAIAALMSGRPEEADGLLDPGLNGTDEIALWRAVLAATRQEGAPEAAAVFASTINLVQAYPAALRNRLLPLAAETMAMGGAGAAADALLAQWPDEPLLAMARAMRLAAKGDTAGALTLYDSLAAGRDRLVSARAATRAILLRFSSHAIGPAEAATALEHHVYDWRGDRRERDLRLRVADLRKQAGQWRPALDQLRETAALYPDDAAMIGARLSAVLGEMFRGPGAKDIPPMDLVTLADENAEAVAKIAPDEAMALLADKLIALDLPRRAGPLLARMIAAAPQGVGRATLGSRLATMQLADGDTKAAAATLDDTQAPNLPSPLLERRGLIDARIHAAAKDVPGAAAILAALDTAQADDLRASLLTEAGDWRGAEAALLSLVSRVIPPDGALDSAQQDIILRLASAESRAGDDAVLRALGLREVKRMAGSRADMFRLLTAAPIAGVGDLPRSAGEMALAHAIPAGLAAMGTGAVTH